jgi:hypothetical protein
MVSWLMVPARTSLPVNTIVANPGRLHCTL